MKYIAQISINTLPVVPANMPAFDFIVNRPAGDRVAWFAPSVSIAADASRRDAHH
jgi:hypothetical protein